MVVHKGSNRQDFVYKADRRQDEEKAGLAEGRTGRRQDWQKAGLAEGRTIRRQNDQNAGRQKTRS